MSRQVQTQRIWWPRRCTSVNPRRLDADSLTSLRDNRHLLIIILKFRKGLSWHCIIPTHIRNEHWCDVTTGANSTHLVTSRRSANTRRLGANPRRCGGRLRTYPQHYSGNRFEGPQNEQNMGSHQFAIKKRFHQQNFADTSELKVWILRRLHVMQTQQTSATFHAVWIMTFMAR